MKEIIENIITMLVVGIIASFFSIPILLTILDLNELFIIWLACGVCITLLEAWLVLWYVPKHLLEGK